MGGRGSSGQRVAARGSTGVPSKSSSEAPRESIDELESYVAARAGFDRFVSVADIRENTSLGDAELRALYWNDRVDMVNEEDQKALTPRIRDAGFKMAGRTFHYISLSRR